MRNINLAKLDTSRQLTVPTRVSGLSTVNLFIYINKIIDNPDKIGSKFFL